MIKAEFKTVLGEQKWVRQDGMECNGCGSSYSTSPELFKVSYECGQKRILCNVCVSENLDCPEDIISIIRIKKREKYITSKCTTCKEECILRINYSLVEDNDGEYPNRPDRCLFDEYFDNSINFSDWEVEE
ncbi:MAG: hypothetical protein ACFFAS_20435 [Promethearchaeota archaeon]